MSKWIVTLAVSIAINLPLTTERELPEPTIMSEEDILMEQKLGDMELIAQLVEAEAGNQGLQGKRYIVDVILNRVDSDLFPNTVEEVIYDEFQFSPILDGGFEKAGWKMSEETYLAVEMEYTNRSNYDILYFGTEKMKYGKNHFKHKDHWFG